MCDKNTKNNTCTCNKNCSCNCCSGKATCFNNHKHGEETKLGRVDKKGHEQSKFHHICGDMGCKKNY